MNIADLIKRLEGTRVNNYLLHHQDITLKEAIAAIKSLTEQVSDLDEANRLLLKEVNHMQRTGSAEEITRLEGRLKRLGDDSIFELTYSDDEDRDDPLIWREKQEDARIKYANESFGACDHIWVKLDNPSVHPHTGTFCSECGSTKPVD